jgi:hypothetical protein
MIRLYMRKGSKRLASTSLSTCCGSVGELRQELIRDKIGEIGTNSSGSHINNQIESRG